MKQEEQLLYFARLALQAADVALTQRAEVRRLHRQRLPLLADLLVRDLAGEQSPYDDSDLEDLFTDGPESDSGGHDQEPAAASASARGAQAETTPEPPPETTTEPPPETTPEPPTETTPNDQAESETEQAAESHATLEALERELSAHQEAAEARQQALKVKIADLESRLRAAPLTEPERNEPERNEPAPKADPIFDLRAQVSRANEARRRGDIPAALASFKHIELTCRRYWDGTKDGTSGTAGETIVACLCAQAELSPRDDGLTKLEEAHEIARTITHGSRSTARGDQLVHVSSLLAHTLYSSGKTERARQVAHGALDLLKRRTPKQNSNVNSYLRALRALVKRIEGRSPRQVERA
ncbi:MAG: hypothetical protein IPK80_28815 [Nannocystis sp.]|nr:hypothetical protein [Nannocystis sp.]